MSAAVAGVPPHRAASPAPGRTFRFGMPLEERSLSASDPDSPAAAPPPPPQVPPPSPPPGGALLFSHAHVRAPQRQHACAGMLSRFNYDVPVEPAWSRNQACSTRVGRNSRGPDTLLQGGLAA